MNKGYVLPPLDKRKKGTKDHEPQNSSHGHSLADRLGVMVWVV